MIRLCRMCGEDKPIEEFYKHPEMTDGYLNQCKKCKRDYQRRYARTKGGKATERRRNQKPARRKELAARSRRWGEDNLLKIRAQRKVSTALRSGKLVRPESCQDCRGVVQRLHAHHENYSRPLDVLWLCVPCHGKRNPNYIG